MRIPCLFIVSIAALLAAACGETPAAPSTSITSPSTETFSSLLTAKGSASRTFATHDRGAVSLTLTSTTPADVVVGVGVGIPKSNGGGCILTASVDTAAGPSAQVSITAETGDYCVQLYDPGTLTEQVAFTLSITHP